jgi:RNA-directed DNA polymerase
LAPRIRFAGAGSKTPQAASVKSRGGERWLTAPIQLPDGTLVEREKGTPQGGVISPLLANLFLRYALDKWMERHFPIILFERYADDVICHCASKKQAKYLLDSIKRRLANCRLELNLQKTKIVFCKDSYRWDRYPTESFDFLGFTFRPRPAKNREGKRFTNFAPAVSNKAAKAIRSLGSSLSVGWTIGAV